MNRARSGSAEPQLVRTTSTRQIVEVETPNMRALVRPTGEYHGIVLLAGPDHDIELTRAGRSAMNLEHYVCKERRGIFVPRREAPQTWRLVDGGAETTFGTTRDWRVETVARYVVLDDAVDVTFTFRFDAAYPGFEAFIASYVPPGSASPWILTQSGWERPGIRLEEQLFVTRDDASSALIFDGRWQHLTDEGRTFRLHEARHTKAVMVTGDVGRRPSLVQMGRREHWSQISPNTFAPAHDIAVIGRDVHAGEEVSVPLRLVARPFPSLEDVEELHANFDVETAADAASRTAVPAASDPSTIRT